jgi:hypothetical protein
MFDEVLIDEAGLENLGAGELSEPLNPEKVDDIDKKTENEEKYPPIFDIPIAGVLDVFGSLKEVTVEGDYSITSGVYNRHANFFSVLDGVNNLMESCISHRGKMKRWLKRIKEDNSMSEILDRHVHDFVKSKMIRRNFYHFIPDKIRTEFLFLLILTSEEYELSGMENTEEIISSYRERNKKWLEIVWDNISPFEIIERTKNVTGWILKESNGKSKGKSKIVIPRKDAPRKDAQCLMLISSRLDRFYILDEDLVF